MASIAINGLGRIGRAALKIIEQAERAGAAAVNDQMIREASPALPPRAPDPSGVEP